MAHLSTITSKRQLTIPSKVFKKARLKKGDKVIVEEKDGELTIKKAADLVEELAGSVKIPDRFRGIDTDEAISIAKKRYFSKKAK